MLRAEKGSAVVMSALLPTVKRDTTAQWSEADVAALLDTTPRLVDGVEWRTRTMADGGAWKLGFTQLATSAPFAMEADDCPVWFSTLLTWCDGKTPAREHLRRLRESGAIPESSPDQQFARLIRQLADAAFIELPELALPPR